MPWIYAIAGLLVGIAVGMLIARLTTPQYKTQKNLQKELESAKFTLEQQRQELSDHFAQTAEMLDTLGKDYTKLYQHMAKTATDLIPNLPEQDNPFSKLAQQKKRANSQKSSNNHLKITHWVPQDFCAVKKKQSFAQRICLTPKPANRFPLLYGELCKGF